MQYEKMTKKQRIEYGENLDDAINSVLKDCNDLEEAIAHADIKNIEFNAKRIIRFVYESIDYNHELF